MAHTFHLQRRVTFAETDMAGIVHFSNFFRYMEETEHAFFRSLGLSIHMAVGGREVCWPRVNAACDYLNPLKFEDDVDIELRVAELAARSVTYRFTFTKAPDILIARGTLTAVCAAFDEQAGRLRAIDIPGLIRDKLSVAPS